jgi:predicted acetyltransferase
VPHVTLHLRPLRLNDENEARDAHAELQAERFVFLLDWEPDQPWAAYLEKLDNFRRGVELPAGHVPATFLVAEVDQELVGRVSIRHRLNEFLAREGGHIGYGVRPRYRRRGYATEILRQALTLARAEGVERVLVTCDDDNAPSAKIIERLGGVLEDVRRGEDGIPKRRYWID